jgi:hypothetical protein
MKQLCTITVVLFLAAAMVNAATVTLTPDADADVRMDAPDYGLGSRDQLYFNTDSNTGKYFKVYMRFELPADFGYAESAQLSLVRSTLGAWNFTYNLHGLKDDVSGQNWVESNGLTWNNAPANDTSSSFAFTQDATGVLDTFSVVGSNNEGTVGGTHTFSSGDLITFLNSDTDGIINLMMSRAGESSSLEAFASKENGTYAAPQLELTYVVPEPVSIALLGFGALVLRRKK